MVPFWLMIFDLAQDSERNSSAGKVGGTPWIFKW